MKINFLKTPTVGPLKKRVEIVESGCVRVSERKGEQKKIETERKR